MIDLADDRMERAGIRAPSQWALSAILGLMLLAAAALLWIVAFGRCERLGLEVERSYQQRLKLTELSDGVRAAQGNERGYLISGNDIFLARYQSDRSFIEQSLQALTLGMADEPEAHARMSLLSQQVLMEFSEMAATIKVGRDLGIKSSRHRLQIGDEHDYIEVIRAEIQAFTAAETSHLAEHRVAAASILGLLKLLMTMVFVAFAGAVAVAIRHEHRINRHRAHLLAKVKESAARQEAILDSAFDAIVTLSPRGTVETANAAATRLFGYAPDELIGRDFSILVDMGTENRSDYVRSRASEEAIAAGTEQQLIGRRKTGATFPIDAALGAMPLPDGLHVVAVARDASEIRRAEAAKDEFISTVSHELRTPLTSIVGSLGLLKAGAAGQLPERATRLVQIADTNSSRLVRLINDILDIEKIQSGQAPLSMELLDLNALALAAFEAMSGFAEERCVIIQITVSPVSLRVSGDEDRLIQVLNNLLSNSIKFSAAGCKVEIKVSQDYGVGRISVIDEGPGIPESFRPKIFTKFAQADGTNGRDHGGTGLGLAIAQEIVQKHHGTLIFRSEEGHGTVFCVDLPLQHDPTSCKQASIGATSILICEDDPLTAEVIKNELEAQGFVVRLTDTANEARDILQVSPFAALLLDMNLPDADGLSLLRALRAAPATSELPIIIVSGAESGCEEARNLDIVDWIEKPIDINRLIGTLQSVVEAPRTASVQILHVDDDLDILELSKGLLGAAGDVVQATSLAGARTAMRRRRPDLIVLDLSLPDGSGTELLQDLAKENGRRPAVVIYTAQDVDRGLAEEVDAVFTKSRTNLSMLARNVRRLTDQRVSSGQSR